MRSFSPNPSNIRQRSPSTPQKKELSWSRTLVIHSQTERGCLDPLGTIGRRPFNPSLKLRLAISGKAVSHRTLDVKNRNGLLTACPFKTKTLPTLTPIVIGWVMRPMKVAMGYVQPTLDTNANPKG